MHSDTVWTGIFSTIFFPGILFLPCFSCYFSPFFLTVPSFNVPSMSLMLMGFAFAIYRFMPASLQKNLQHLLTLFCKLVIAHIRKCALHIPGEILHHLISVTGLSAFCILLMVIVISIKCHFAIRRILFRHISRLYWAAP